MKNNTSESKILLEKAIQSLPSDNALQGARYHLKCALSDIQKVEGKRQTREVVRKSVEKEYQEKMKNLFIAPQNAKSVLDSIDSMIEEEQNKIDNMKKKSDKPTQQTNDDQDWAIVD